MIYICKYVNIYSELEEEYQNKKGCEIMNTKKSKSDSQKPKSEKAVVENKNNEFWTIEEAADYFRVTYQTVKKLIENKEMPCHKIGKCYRIPIEKAKKAFILND